MSEWTEKDIKEISEWNEKDHPRDGDRKFTDGGGNTTDKKIAAIRKYSDDPEKDMREQEIGKIRTLSDFVSRVKNGKAKSGEKFELGKITNRAKKDIESLTGQKINAEKHIISVDEIKHIEKGHGEFGRSDHSMDTVEDYERIADVLNNYDRLDFARNKKGEIDTTHAYLDKYGKPAKLIKFSKHYPNNVQFVIEAVNDTKGRLHIISSYKKGTNSK